MQVSVVNPVSITFSDLCAQGRHHVPRRHSQSVSCGPLELCKSSSGIVSFPFVWSVWGFISNPARGFPLLKDSQENKEQFIIKGTLKEPFFSKDVTQYVCLVGVARLAVTARMKQRQPIWRFTSSYLICIKLRKISVQVCFLAFPISFFFKKILSWSSTSFCRWS